MHEIFEEKGPSVQSNARIVKLRIKFEQRKISLGQTVNRILAWIQRQFKSEVQQVLMAEDKILRKAFDSQEIFWVCD
jgi:hypothetical protein